MVHDLKAFAAAIAGAAEYTSEQMVHNIEDLEATARSTEDRRIVEFVELG